MNTAGSTAFLNGKEATVNRKQDYTLYDYLNWIKIRKQVSKLQTRIAKAVMNSCPVYTGLRLLEPYDGKLSRTVLRGEEACEGFLLPDF